jgi:hypothetical protein
MADQDPYASFGGSAVKTEVPSAPAPTPQLTPSGDPYASFGGHAISSSASSKPASDPYAEFGGSYSPGTEQSPKKYETGNPNMPWYERAWDWANTPLVNLNSENKGGFVGGTEDVVSGLTSPLSIGLTVATLGGGALLRGLGLAAEELPVAVRGLKALVDAGFTAQGALQAAKESPRVLDALKEGDYDTAKRLAVHVLAGGAVATLGAREAFHYDAPMLNPLLEKAGTKFRFSEENLKLRREEGIRQREQQAGAAEGRLYKAAQEKKYKELDDISRAGTGKLMEAGLNTNQIGRHLNYLLDAAGRSDEKVPVVSPENELRTPEQIADRHGIPYRGEVSPGTGVHDFQAPDGGSIGLRPEELTDKFVKEKLARRKEEINPANLDPALAAKKPVTIEEEAQASPRLPNPDEADTPQEESRYQELADQQLLKNSKNYNQKQLDRLIDIYKAAYKPSPLMQELARDSRLKLDEMYEINHQKGVVSSFIENYLSHRWAKDLDNPAANTLMHDAKSGYFETRGSMGMHRVFRNAFEGELLGRRLDIDDPIDIVAHHIAKSREIIANRDMLDRITGTEVTDPATGNKIPYPELRASDGRPATALSGTGQLVEEDGKNPALLLDGNKMRPIQMTDAKVEELKATGTLDKLISDGTILRLEHEGEKPIYKWSTKDYRVIPHSAFSNWNFGAHAPDGTPAFVKSELRVHPEFYDYLNKLINPEKPGPLVGAALKAGSVLKHTILSFSPFHIAQEGLRALMTGINPFKVDIADIHGDDMLRRGAEEGATFYPDKTTEAQYQDGLASGPDSLFKKVPLLGTTQAHLQKFLFEQYIPSLKGRAFKALMDRYGKRLDNAETFAKLKEDRSDMAGYDKVRAAARLAAEDVNERFGGLNYRQFGRSAATQDFLKLATLAPDWMESEVRFAKRLFTPGIQGAVARHDMVAFTAAMWGAARILNLITSGKPHLEAPFGVATTDSEGREKIYSMRTLPGDIMHAVSDPAGFIKGRISPLGRIASEVYTGRDSLGRKQSGFGTLVDLGSQVLPIPAQAGLNALRGQSPDLTNVDQGVKALGGTATVYRTQAQTKAAQLASEKSESGPVDPAQLRKHHALIEFEDRLRSGEMPITDIHKMVEDGALPVKDAKEIVKNVKETQGLDPEMARLHSRASRLPMSDFLQVYDLATNDEKMALVKLLLKKKATYFKKIATETTPQERLSDPTYNRLRKLFPQAEPW